MVRRINSGWGRQPRPAYKAPKDIPWRNHALEAVVCSAIAKKVQVEFVYDSVGRIFSPHVAWVTQEGNAVVYGIQTSGGIEGGPHSFTISKMLNLRMTNRHFARDRAFVVTKYREGVICCIN